MPGGKPLRFANKTQDKHLKGWLSLGTIPAQQMYAEGRDEFPAKTGRPVPRTRPRKPPCLPLFRNQTAIASARDR